MKLLRRTLKCIAIIVGLFLVVILGIRIFIAVRLRPEIVQGPNKLAAELSILRSEGIPTSAAELQRPVPPTAVNAAPDYKKLKALLGLRPLTSEEALKLQNLGLNGRSTSTQDAAVSRILKRRSDIMALVYQAARKPQCVFVRDWSQGIKLDLTDYASLREAAKLLRARSYLLAKAGRYHDAVATDALAFRVADHAGSDPILIGYLVGTSCDGIALSGMAGILQLSGPNAAVVKDVQTTIIRQRPSLNLRRALGGEVVMDIGTARMGREQGAAGIPAGAGEAPDPGLFRVLKAAGVNGMFDAMLAVALHYQRLLIEATSLPESQQRAAFKQVITKETQRSDAGMNWMHLDLTPLLASVLIPVMKVGPDKEILAHAQERVVMAGADVLAYRARHGAYPDRLDQTSPDLPRDPFTQKPLLYRKESHGFVVYSAGPTGHFDGQPGRPHEDKEAFFRYPGA